MQRNIFNGSYVDEFALLGGREVERVLVWGSDDGAPVMALQAASPGARITLVGTDLGALKKTKAHFRKLTPPVKIEIASELPEPEETFDVIWVDLFARPSLSERLLDPPFFKRLFDTLSPRGTLGVHLAAAKAPFALQMRDYFPFVSRFPFGNHVSWIGRKIRATFSRAYPNLSQLDQLQLDILRLRSENPWDGLAADTDVDVGKYSKRLTAPTLAAREILEMTRSMNGTRFNVPVAIGALSNGNDHLASVFLEYMVEYGRNEAVSGRLPFIHYFLPQLASVLCRGQFDSKSLFLVEKLVKLIGH